MSFKSPLKKRLNSFVAGVASFAGVTLLTQKTQAQEKENTTEYVNLDAQKAARMKEAERVLKLKKGADDICIRKVIYDLKAFEGNIDYIYIDSEGNPTVGIGINVNSWEQFKKLEFMKDKNNKLNDAEKLAYYNQIQAYKNNLKSFNHSASFYKNTFKRKPTQESVDALFAECLQDSVEYVEKMFGSRVANNMHPYGRAIAIELYFNMGAKKFNRDKFKKFVAGAESYNYLKMSVETKRKKVSASRIAAEKETLIGVQKCCYDKDGNYTYPRIGDYMMFYKAELKELDPAFAYYETKQEMQKMVALSGRDSKNL